MNASFAPSLLLIVPTLITCSGLVTMLICRPLIRGTVAPNPFYGIRTPRAFRSQEDWYRINQLGGRMLSHWGGFVCFVGLAGFPCFLAGVNGMIAYNVIAAVLILGSLLAVTIRLLRIS